MNILLISPAAPVTYWSLKYALYFVSKKAALPPLGLLTVAAMLPQSWNIRLVDMNVNRLKNDDIRWADYVFIGAMHIQRTSANRVIKRCIQLGKKTVCGGPLFTAIPEEYAHVDHILINEAETTLPQFLADLEHGTPAHIYSPNDLRADMKKSPTPRWDLIDLAPYSLASIQYSRGCPYNCDFCNITALLGRKYRTKAAAQIIAELNAIYNTGWRGGVFFVDDNFIGSRQELKKTILPAIMQWMQQKNSPFYFNTQASIDLADDDDCLVMMAKAGFNCVFVGIETPSQQNLSECGKIQNKNRDLVSCVHKIQGAGLEVQGGFILGFDNDTNASFDNLIDFIQQSGIMCAMVGLLNAPIGTKLYDRLKRENRLSSLASGDNTDFTMNFHPKMPAQTLLAGYQQVIETIYSPRIYHQRLNTFLSKYKPIVLSHNSLSLADIKTFLRSIWYLGFADDGRWYYWKAVLAAVFRPRTFSLVISFQIMGLHFRKIFEELRPNMKYLTRPNQPLEAPLPGSTQQDVQQQSGVSVR